MISPRKALERLGRRPAKGLGQNFLIHQATAEKIAAALRPGPGDVVVEIGALQRSGYPTGIELAAAIETGKWLQEQLGHPVPGMLVKAGDFPPTGGEAAPRAR